jgi:acetoacetyl-CoA synthetase
MAMESPQLLWSPDHKLKSNSNLQYYIEWLRREKSLSFGDYQELWKWSVSNVEMFWQTICEYFEIVYEGKYDKVKQGAMPEVEWFPGMKLNYAENLFKNSQDEFPAIIFKSELSKIEEMSWKDLQNSVGAVQRTLEKYGVAKGDRVAGYLPCIPEATVSMLATTGLGAIWSSASPDFGVNAVIDRFTQIEPKVLIAVDHYNYNGKAFDKTDVIESLAAALPSVKCIIVISQEKTVDVSPGRILWKDAVAQESAAKFLRVEFNHPLWILFSSGTTGLPKAITHSHGGILLEQLKYGSFHNDFKTGQRCFWYTTTGWMMWNYIHGALLAGATMVLYDGSPGYPDLAVLWKFAEEARINHFGTSAAFILANMKAGVKPSESSRLDSLISIGSTGSTLPEEGFKWVYQHVKQNIWLASMSGGTDVCSAFVGGNPLWPVYAGEIQCRALGCKLEAFDEGGNSIVDEVGEMVITEPMPSMPIFFWGDKNFERYSESYFEMFPHVWRHGDWTKITPRHGVVIYGRSDATLNRGGVRIGTSEIYRAVDKVNEIKDSLIICIEKHGGEFWMPLFVVMQPGYALDQEVRSIVNSTIKKEYSPRHVPDEIIEVPDIPYTISGKKTETPVKKVLMGKDISKVVNEGSLRNPDSMKFFARLAAERKNS